MRAQRREAPVRAGAGTVPALERQPRRPPNLGTAPARRVNPSPVMPLPAWPPQTATSAVGIPVHRTSEYLHLRHPAKLVCLEEASAGTRQFSSPRYAGFDVDIKAVTGFFTVFSRAHLRRATPDRPGPISRSTGTSTESVNERRSAAPWRPGEGGLSPQVAGQPGPLPLAR